MAENHTLRIQYTILGTMILRPECVGEAAERLQISQSMVTIHIRNLEAELGTRLINRTTRSMELSHDGRTFYYYARQMLRLNRDSLFALTRADQDERAINIVATPYTSRYYLSNRIAEFRRQHPDVHFSVTVCYNSEIHGKLRTGGFQFAFCNMKIMDADFAARRYNSASIVAITPNEERFRALQGKPFPAEHVGAAAGIPALDQAERARHAAEHRRRHRRHRDDQAARRRRHGHFGAVGGRGGGIRRGGAAALLSARGIAAAPSVLYLQEKIPLAGTGGVSRFHPRLYCGSGGTRDPARVGRHLGGR